MPTPLSAQNIVNQAMKLMNQGNYSAALQLFISLEQAGMRDPRLFRSMGVAHERLNNPAQACRYFEHSINMSPNQADLHESLTKLYAKQKQWTEAESWHNKNIARFPSESSYSAYGFFCLNRTQHGADDKQYVVKAKSLFESAQTRFGNSETIQLGFAQVLAEQGDWETQNALLTKSVVLYPSSLKLKRALAWSDKQCGKYKEAASAYASLINTDSANEDDEKRLAITLVEQGDIDDALSHLNAAVERNPTSQTLHKLLASVRYESGDENFLDGYMLIGADSRTLPLQLDYIDQCIDSKQYKSAETMLDDMPISLKSHPMVVNRRAKLAYRCHDDKQCIALTTTLLEGAPNNPALIELRALASLSLGDYSKSRADISVLLAQAPADQFYWGLQSVQWRLDNDPHYHWLCDYDNLVKRVPIDVPEGYVDKSEFIHSLKTCLTNLHVTKRHPLTQSLRQGTQTPGELFLRKENTIQALAAQLNKSCVNALSAMNIDSKHPTFCDNLKGVSFQTSWSVKLKNQGFHASHVHPKGWFSSAFYVQVPGVDDNSEKQGWLHLGQPGVRVHTPLEPERWIEPEEGVLVLFPSFMWHGTAPFESADDRLSVAFDLLPQ
eukprot:TRINITY_DN34_c0_g5_i1.p1 TRINITY_DN34_c0_g5~~TRINITY_DN34_c0_g5_i1.p1  ORF type:complete len:610 (+),score=71.93 TRINITY_DN34_c0_g5_i1:4841-6670(+)